VLKSHRICPACYSAEVHELLTGIPDRLGLENSKIYSYLNCQHCDFIFLSPTPSESQIASFYPESFWRVKDEEGGRKQSFFERLETYLRKGLMIRELDSWFSKVPTPNSALDVGCATGDFMELLHERGIDVEGVEFSESAVAFCREKKKLMVQRGDLPDLIWGAKKFDLIVYNGVLEHVLDPVKHLNTCRRIINEEGHLVIRALPNVESFGFFVRGKNWISIDYPRHLSLYSKSSLKALLEKCGFSVVEITTHSPRFNGVSLVSSLFPSLHRHKFDEEKARTGRNPVIKKVILFGLLQIVRPIDFLISCLGYGEHLNAIVKPAKS
jgi:2-polyprenyl-3-methyl-5-hydroxy-6-metoxy-1,4-benzoquinol methylase